LKRACTSFPRWFAAWIKFSGSGAIVIKWLWMNHHHHQWWIRD
jgi:hypothetical protein